MERSDTPLPGPIRILKAGIGHTFANIGLLTKSGSPVALLFAGIWTVAEIWYPGEEVLVAISVIGLAAFSWFWHRRYLTGLAGHSFKPSSGEGAHDDRVSGISRCLLDFIWRVVMLTIVGCAAVLVGTLIVALFTGFGDDEIDAAVEIGMVPTAIVITFPAARILPMFGAISIGDRMSWSNAWHLSRGTGLKLAIALILVGLVYFVLIELWTYLLTETDSQSPYAHFPLYFGAAVTDVIFTAVASSCNAFVFRELTAWQHRKNDILETFD